MIIHLAHLSGLVVADSQYFPVPSWMNLLIGSPEEKIIASWEAAEINTKPSLSFAFWASHPETSVTFFWEDPTRASSIVTASALWNWIKAVKRKIPIKAGLNTFSLWTKKPANIASDGRSITP